jgi:hypothetical protein
MAFRTFATFAIQTTNTPQPLIGSWLSAIVSGSLAQPANQPVTVTLGTATSVTSGGNDATNIFLKGEDAWLIDPSGANAEAVHISNISGNNLTFGLSKNVGGSPQGAPTVTTNPHVVGVFGTGTFIMPKPAGMNNLFFSREDGGTGIFMYLGNAYNMNANFRRIVKLANVATGNQPLNYSASESYFGDPFDISELWVYGTAGDLYSATLNVA